MNNLYRKKYLISIYKCDYQDTLIAVLDNANQFADFFGITIENARMILSNFFNKKHENFRYDGELCEIHFINMEEE